MLGREPVEALVHAIYGAVGEERLWPDLLVRLRGRFRTVAAALIGHDFASRSGADLCTSGLDPDYTALAAKRFAAENP